MDEHLGDVESAVVPVAFDAPATTIVAPRLPRMSVPPHVGAVGRNLVASIAVVQGRHHVRAPRIDSASAASPRLAHHDGEQRQKRADEQYRPLLAVS
jgi:hypothetical protein